MKKEIIEVPEEVRYISEWVDFDITLLQGHSIINKTITGCGFTHYCLTNDIPTILCSPRKMLLENKNEQISDTFVVVNSGEKSLNVDETGQGITEKSKESYEDILDLKTKLSNYLLYCKSEGKIPKILVTYDSLKYVLEVLGLDIAAFSIIVDEFQNIFMDASFKAETELNFVSYLQSCPNVTYLSATPYIEEYLNELDEFKDLTYYELKWDPSKLRTVEIFDKRTNNISKEIDRIIKSYLKGDFPTRMSRDGALKVSTEVVFYVNSVTMIRQAIKRNNLTPDQVNIICADTALNRYNLKKLKGDFKVGKAPLRGQPHKMFTFCTRTTYVGTDFYSTCASTVIISDCKIDSLVTDIRMDFPQIMGRQRLEENIFRNECTFIYKLADSSISIEEYERIKEDKLQSTLVDIQNFNVLKETGEANKNKLLLDLRRRIFMDKYSGDYTGIDEKTGTVVLNKLVLLSEKRAFELRSNVYKNKVQVYDEFANSSVDIELHILADEIKDLQRIYESPGSFNSKMKAICEFLSANSGKVSYQDLKFLSPTHKSYFSILSLERMRAIGYREASFKEDLKTMTSTDRIRDRFYSEFILGHRYTLHYLKSRVGVIYGDLGISDSPKATDILKYFEAKKCLITEEGKRVNGLELLSYR